MAEALEVTRIIRAKAPDNEKPPFSPFKLSSRARGLTLGYEFFKQLQPREPRSVRGCGHAQDILIIFSTGMGVGLRVCFCPDSLKKLGPRPVGDIMKSNILLGASYLIE
jgi:hypothetical protein